MAFMTSPATTLFGRHREQDAIDRLLRAARDGAGGVLVLHGEPGVGKSALLNYAVQVAGEIQIARTSGVEGEMEMPFAAVQQLCSPLLGQAVRLPPHQRQALDVAFGIDTGPAPEPFFVGLALLGLLSEAAEERPLLCVIDDAHWLDDASARAIAFPARRLLAVKIAIVIGTRELGSTLQSLPELPVKPLARRDARTLLRSSLPARLDERVLERIVDEAQGNPLALLELPRGLTPAELAGGFGLPVAATLPVAIEESFMRRLSALPDGARRLLLAAAADPLGDTALLSRSARKLGIPSSAVDVLEAEGLLKVGVRVVFRHPLLRSAVYRAAALSERREIHRVLAEVTDREKDPDRRAWHMAQTASMPDEEIAADLERSASRAQARGGSAAVAAFLQRAAALTPDPARKAGRLVAAASAKRDAGDHDGALELLLGTETDRLDELGRARVTLLQARIAVEQGRGDDAGRLFLEAAHRLEPIAPELARETYLETLGGALANDLEVGGGARVVAAAALAAPAGPAPLRPADAMLHALASRLIDGYAVAAPALARALQLQLAVEVSDDQDGPWFSVSAGRNANVVALEMWDDEAVRLIAARHVQIARDTGALGHLHFALSFLSRGQILAGDLAAAAMAVDEARSIAKATQSRELVNAPLVLAAWRGGEADATELIGASAEEAARRGWTSNKYAQAVLYNGLGRHEAALEAARDAWQREPIGYATFLVPELAEAASRTADKALLVSALTWISERTSATGSRWASGIQARVQALLDDTDRADGYYRESIEHLSSTSVRLELARSHLLYGEWLRRERRRLDARGQLRTALEQFTTMGVEAFALRAERELLATGERARRRTADTVDQLTPQEKRIALLAARGRRNREIAAELFISPSTVDYHLRKVFRKLDVKSRTQLAHRLS
jgi:DNA-binding CsgD family transcriptional regulator